jgi:calcineurin-like phosphoesterase family protein
MRTAAAALAAALAAAALAACGHGDTRTSGGPAAGNTARAAGDAAARAVVWAVGDAATPGPAADRIGALIRRADPDRFLYLGDVYETGTLRDFRRWYHPRFGRLAHITSPTIGNHEWDNRFRGYYRYWAARKGRRWPPWSKFRIAGWEILDLNSQAPHGPGSAQVRWLEHALTGPGDCRIAFWHRPRYSEGAYDGAPDLNPLWNRLAGHARIVLSGHDHNLQRHRPQKGLTQYVVGAGGRARYRLHGGRGTTMAWGRDNIDGALRMVLKPGSALLEFRGPRGRVLDRSHASCTPGVPPAAAQ